MSNTLDWEDKINSPALEAWFQQFGLKYYLSAEQINEIRDTINFLLLNNTSQSDTIIQDNGFVIESGVFKAAPGTIWNIIGVQYTNPILVEVPIALASTGMQRFYRIVLNTNNTFQLISGDESVDYPAIPNKGLNQLDYTVVLVTDSVIGTPTAPLVGDAFIKKIYNSNYTFQATGNAVSIPLPAQGYSMFTFSNSGLASIKGFNLSQINATTDAEIPFENKNFLIFNNTGHDLELIDQEDTDPTNIPFQFRVAGNIIIPNGEFIRLSYTSSGFFDLDKSWASAGSAAFSTLTGSPSDNAALTSVLNDKANKSETYTKTEINSKLSAVFVYKGSVSNYTALTALTGQEIGWSYNLTETGDNYAWDGSVWDKLSGIVDILGKEDVSNKKTDIESNKNSNTFYASCKAIIDFLKNNLVSNLPAKSTILVDTDSIIIGDSEDTLRTKTRTFAQLKSNLKSYFDTVYSPVGGGSIGGSGFVFTFQGFLSLNSNNAWYGFNRAEGSFGMGGILSSNGGFLNNEYQDYLENPTFNALNPSRLILHTSKIKLIRLRINKGSAVAGQSLEIRGFTHTPNGTSTPSNKAEVFRISTSGVVLNSNFEIPSSAITIPDLLIQSSDCLTFLVRNTTSPSSVFNINIDMQIEFEKV